MLDQKTYLSKVLSAALRYGYAAIRISVATSSSPAIMICAPMHSNKNADNREIVRRAEVPINTPMRSAER